jgi:hypothetical protein
MRDSAARLDKWNGEGGEKQNLKIKCDRLVKAENLTKTNVYQVQRGDTKLSPDGQLLRMIFKREPRPV